MGSELSITEIRFIRNLLSKKTDQELADMLGKPVALISDQILQMTGVIIRPVVKREKKQRVEKKAKRPGRPKSVKPVVEKPIRASVRVKAGRVKIEKPAKKPSISALEIERARQKKKALERETFAVKPIDLTGKIPVKLNHKTTVYVKPGTDINALKKKLNIL